MFRKLLLVLCLVWPVAAQAEWREASSRNFIVYGESSEARLREFTEKLERFDRVLRLMHNIQSPPSPNRLRVFLFPDINGVQRMAGGSGVAGYYVSDSRGVMLVGTSARTRQRGVEPEAVLLHEYTHHFMFHYFPAAYPTWYSEGFAEFWGETRFIDANTVEVGHPVDERLNSFTVMPGRWLPIERLLTARSYADVPELDLLYAEGWLLVRYAWGDAERQRQLQQYLTLINEGASYEQAMTQVYGEGARRLNNELFDYAGRNRFDVVRLPFRELDPGQVAVRTLRPAEQAMILHEIELSQGVSQYRFESFAGEVRETAARFPDDPFALRLLVEVERIANRPDTAAAAADRLLTVAPDDARGLMHKAMIEVDALRAAGSTDERTWEAARDRLRRAHRLAPGDPLPLEALYDSYVAQDRLPPEEAQNALYDALDLAPSDSNLRYKLAADFEQRRMIEEAIAIIRPHAYQMAHRDDETERERRRRERLEDRYRRAGTARRETAREMLERLQGRETRN